MALSLIRNQEKIEGDVLLNNDVAKQHLALKVPCAPVRQLSEVMLDENMHEKGSLQWIDHPELGRVVLPHSPLIFEGLERKALEPSLPLGASNAQVFGHWLGYSVKDLEQLKVEGVISQSNAQRVVLTCILIAISGRLF